MNTRDLILQEIEDTPKSILEEVLDFLRYLKQKCQQTKSVVVVSDGQEARVALEDVLGNERLQDQFLRQPLSPVDKIQREMGEALAAGGYETREQIVELVQEVKREMLDEQHTFREFAGILRDEEADRMQAIVTEEFGQADRHV